MNGVLKAIGFKKEKYGTIFICEEAFVGLNSGVQNDIRGNPGKRQVTILSEEAFNLACRELDAKLPWTLRRANLLISGIEFKDTKGRKIRIGEVLLEITGETDPCYRMDEQFDGLKNALFPDWRGGVTCRVLAEGNIKSDDLVELV